jgi:putative urate catabolism protein
MIFNFVGCYCAILSYIEATERGAMTYPRDMIGYGGNPPKANWPGGARLALQFVLNYEEGGENSILHGDPASEIFLSEIVGAAPFEGARHMSMESLYEYGSRAGVWRVLDVFRERQLPLTVFAVAMAAARNPAAMEQALADGHEIASHGLRWINYHGMAEAEERAQMQEAVEILTNIAGERPLGWYTGRTSENTRRLVTEYGGFLYDADDYSDDLPFWSRFAGEGHLIVPYTLDTNDMRFATPQGFNSGDQFLTYLKDAFDALYREGEETPKMLSVDLHCRLIGRPGRIQALAKFLDYVLSHDRVWVCRRVDIARHWREHHPPEEVGA